MKKLMTVIVLLLVMSLLVPVSCGAPPPPAPMPPAPPAPAPAPPPPEIKITVPPAPMIVPPTTPAPTPRPAPMPQVPPPGPAPVTGAEPVEVSQPWSERMIIHTGDMALVVTDIAFATERIAGLADSFGGYVVSSNSWRERDRMVGRIVIRVIAEHFDDAIRALREMAVEVTAESTSGQDVTEEYVDLSARLHNLEVSEEQLLELMKQAGKVEEILEVQRELVKTRGEIEQTKGRMQYLEQSTSTSLIQVRLEQAELDVSFTASNRRVKEGQDVYFEPEIAGGISPYSYEWDFGDGNTSTDAAPTHAYQSEGSYNVSLKVTDDRGNTDAKDRSNYIEVRPGWSAGNTASSAWNGLAAFGRVLADIIIWVGYFSPLWIVIGIILYFAWWRRRKRRA